MRPFDIVEKHLPQQAGKAAIEWATTTTAKRDGPVITLPLQEEGEFIPLKRGTQFLYMATTRYNDHLYFGGTDENPFLVELDPGMKVIAKNIPKQDEGNFYRHLKPRIVLQLEAALGVRGKRQGDIFGVKVGENWKALRMFVNVTGLTVDGDETKGGELRVFDTRHVLKGQWVTAVSYYKKESWSDKIGGERRTLFGTGVLEAPDHAPRVLKGVHVLAQVEVLARPKEAD